MRSIGLPVIALLLAGCAEPPPPYDPATFRPDLERLIQAERFSVAIAYLGSADPARQADFDKVGYLAVGEDKIVLPGVDPKITYVPSRDRFIPGTSDAIKDARWQRAATRFAAAYNRRRQSGEPGAPADRPRD